MLKLLAYPSQIVSVSTNGLNYKPGKFLGDINVLENYSILIEDSIIKDLVLNSNIRPDQFDEIIDVKNKVVLPGLVDCHTHTAFAGSRAEEFKLKIAGVSYEEIAKSGGGINKTVSSVRNLDIYELYKIIKPRINYFIEQGITTLEVKSGYGLSITDEIKLLQVIQHISQTTEIEIIPTFLGAHTYPPEFKLQRDDYVNLITSKMLPAVSQNRLAVFCDAFCELTAFSAKEIDQIFTAANQLGFKLKLHTEQFNRIGGIDLGIKYSVSSMDHLEVISESDIQKIAESKIACVLLPGVSFCLKNGYAPARKLIENDAVVALSTDFNPGSSPISNLNLIMSIAAVEMKMTVEETISAVTINAAKALDLNHKIGSIEPGKSADFAVFDTSDYADIVYYIGKNLNCMTIKNGKIIYKKNMKLL